MVFLLPYPDRCDRAWIVSVVSHFWSVGWVLRLFTRLKPALKNPASRRTRVPRAGFLFWPSLAQQPL